jgi:hypothetical protein
MNADESAGLTALKEFFNYSVSEFSDFSYSNFDNFYSTVKAVPHSAFIAEGLGLAINSNEMSGSSVTAAMHALADQGGGKIPSSMNGWFSALTNEASKVNFLDATVYVAQTSAVDLANGAKYVGDQVIETGKSLLSIAPLALTAAALFILYRKSKSI